MLHTYACSEHVCRQLLYDQCDVIQRRPQTTSAGCLFYYALAEQPRLKRERELANGAASSTATRAQSQTSERLSFGQTEASRGTFRGKSDDSFFLSSGPRWSICFARLCSYSRPNTNHRTRNCPLPGVRMTPRPSRHLCLSGCPAHPGFEISRGTPKRRSANCGVGTWSIPPPEQRAPSRCSATCEQR